MLKEQSTIIRRIVIGIDVFLSGVAFPLAFYVRFQRFPLSDDLQQYSLPVLVFIPLFIFSLYRQKLYHQLRFIAVQTIVKKVFVAFAVTFFLVAALLFMSHATYYSRLLFGYFSIGAFSLVLLAKIGLKSLLNRIRQKGYNFRQVLIVGSGRKLAEIEAFFHSHGSYGIKIFASLEASVVTPASFKHVLTNNVIDEVYFALDRGASPRFTIDTYLEIAEQAGKTSKIMLNINEHRRSSCDFTRLGGMPVVVLHPVVLDPDQMLVKRLLDIAGAIVGLLLNAVLFPAIAVAIKMDSPGPVFFVQPRVGINGRLFSLYKYRSMCVDAEERKKELADQNELNGAVFKITNDPRVTRVGRMLRRLSLDELPQFWNVLRGEMSLVGTRPPTPAEVAEYQLSHYRRLSIKPGITGLWQVSGRNRINDFEQIVALDKKYIDQWSLWLDVKIIFKTLLVLGSGK